MRPVDKGAQPYDTIDKYQEARGELIKRLGELCSYCEMHLDAGLAVEHVQPKSLQPSKECDWANLLLACSVCNSIKKDTDVKDSNLHDYLWPDIDNTFLALRYSVGGIVSVNEELPEEVQQRAWKLIRLVGLDRTPGYSAEMSDRRWQNRREAWDKAQNAKRNLALKDSEEMRQTITLMLDAFFSIWMTVFADDADMKRRFIEKFIGTSKECFDANGNAVPRVHKTH